MGIEASPEFNISLAITKSALEIFDNVLVCLSGGKDSVLMTYIVSKALRVLGGERVSFVIGDPYPLEGNVEFCEKVLDMLGLPAHTYPRIRFSDHLPPQCHANFIAKTKDVERCCFWCKVKALSLIVEKTKAEAVFVAVRWDEHPARAKDPYFRKVSPPLHIRVEPILHWPWSLVLDFYREHPELLNPLYLKGYTSLGCKPCTSPTINRTFKTAEEYIDYVQAMILRKELEERAGRIQDKEKIMERLRAIGYF